MEAWLALTLGTKIIDVLIIIGAIALILFLIAIFIKFVGFKNLKVGEVELSNNPEETDPKKIVNENNKEVSLFSHRIFDILASKKDITLYLQKNELSDKEIINEQYLRRCFFYCLDNDLYRYIRDLQKSNGIVLDSFLQVLTKSIVGSKELAKNIDVDLNDKYTLKGIPDVYIKKIESKINNHIGFCYEGIQAILNDQFYPNWNIKMKIILEYLVILISLIVDDANNGLAELNGELSKEINEKKTKYK
jgi:hypothetical protein